MQLKQQNNFNECLIFVAYKELHIFPRNISDSYHVFKLIIIRTKNVHHNVLELIIRYKILSCVIWKLLLWIKKDIFRSHYFYAHPFQQRQSQVTMSPYHFNRSPFVIFPISSMYTTTTMILCSISIWYYSDTKFVIVDVPRLFSAS